MNYLTQWYRRPQQIWLRRALFQLHLWTGIALGLYIFIVSISGSAVVFRNELYENYSRVPRGVAVGEKRLSKEDLDAIAEQAYPGHTVSYVWESKKPNEATELWLSRGNTKLEKLFDPYTGRDMGDAIPQMIHIVKWIADLHTDLLFGKTGRIVNGWGGFVVALLCLTGLIIWWPGLKNWKRALLISPSSGWKRINWDLHSAMGFWTLSIVFLFGITGSYLVFTMPFQKVINYFWPLRVYALEPLAQLAAPTPPVQIIAVADEKAPSPPRQRRRRPPPNYSTGDKIVRWSSYLLFGNFAGVKTKITWIVLGLIPPFLFVTGFIMWWVRVVSRELRKFQKKSAEPVAA